MHSVSEEHTKTAETMYINGSSYDNILSKLTFEKVPEAAGISLLRKIHNEHQHERRKTVSKDLKIAGIFLIGWFLIMFISGVPMKMYLLLFLPLASFAFLRTTISTYFLARKVDVRD